MSGYIFRQTRIGKDGKPFLMFKFRTMYPGAEKDRENFRALNEADGPVFKIKDDPRYTKLGKVLAYTGLDELPQFLNVLKGEMSVVGPRPLPPEEESKIPRQWRQNRRSVKPGITSSWAVGGSHSLSFPQWMELDMEDIHNKTAFYDAMIMVKTFRLLIINVSRTIFSFRHSFRVF